MNRVLLEESLFALSYLPEEVIGPRQQSAIGALHRELRKPDPEPVGWAVLDDTGVIYTHRHRDKAEEWLNRGVPGRSVKPVYLS